MDRNDVLAEMQRTGIVAVIRAKSAESLMDVSKALHAGGVTCLEVTMTTPDALAVIARVSKEMGKQVVVGVGSVLDAETGRAAILAGAKFVVSPMYNADLVQLCRRYAVATVPGALTPTEIVNAWQGGADVVKVFPATKFGPEYFKDILGPLPQIKLTPTGGVDVKTAPEFIKAGAVFVGAGSSLLPKKMMDTGDWAGIQATAKSFIDAIKAARA